MKLKRERSAGALSPAEQIDMIRNKHGRLTLQKKTEQWLDTGSRRLNAVLGSEEKGLAYGKIVELHGPNSHGKTLLATLLAALAQKDGATVLWVDLENSVDEQWMTAQGVDFSQLFVVRPQVIKSKGSEFRLETAEEVFQVAEDWMALQQKQGATKLMVVVDSVAAILVEDEAEAGLTEQNMRTGMSLPKFLSRLLRRWAPFAENYQVLMVFINQIRVSPMAFGNPEYTPGGEAAKFYASVRVAVRRVKNGRLLQNGRVIGLRGTLKNVKNKAGAGSVEGRDCGFETRFGKQQWKFPSTVEVKKSAAGGGEVSDGD